MTPVTIIISVINEKIIKYKIIIIKFVVCCHRPLLPLALTTLHSAIPARLYIPTAPPSDRLYDTL